MTDALQPNEALQSQLSAFIDDELPGAETDLLVRRLIKEQELKQTMARYQLIGEALRNPDAQALRHGLSRDFSQRVTAALERDVPQKRERVAWSAWLKPVAGLSMAAGVAGVALLSIGARPGSAPAALASKSESPAVVSSSLSASPSNSYVVPAAASAPSVPVSGARLTNYIVAHSEFASPLGRRNTLSGLMSTDQSQPAANEPLNPVTTAASDDVSQ